jgi:TonB family protein
MEVEVQAPQSELEPHLLVDWKADHNRPPLSVTAIGSILIHLLLFAAAMFAPSLPGRQYAPFPDAIDVRKSTPLFLPKELLTQKAPNKREVSKDLDLAGLIAKPDIKPTPAAAPLQAPRKFQPPPLPTASTQPVIKTVDPAKLEPAPTLQAQTPPAIGNIQQPLPVNVPPPPPPVEKPKLAFENPGSQTGSNTGRGGLLQGPNTSVDQAARQAMKNGGSASVNESDLQMPGLSPNQASPSKGSSSLELLSDPMGVDFRPYLIRVLAVVRRNWFLVLPEGARMGQRGRTIVQFAIAKDGSVPKAVIHSPSGSQPLDRAAISGISMSNPFPPLPNEYKGDVLRLQLVFSYNMPTR